MWKLEQILSYGPNLEFIYKGCKFKMKSGDFEHKVVTQQNYHSYIQSILNLDNIYPMLYSMDKMSQSITVEGYNYNKPFIPFVELFRLIYGISLELSPIFLGCKYYYKTDSNKEYYVIFDDNKFQIYDLSDNSFIETKPLDFGYVDYLTLWHFNWRNINKFVEKGTPKDIYSQIGKSYYFYNKTKDLVEYGEICGFDDNKNAILTVNGIKYHNVMCFKTDTEAYEHKLKK